MLREAERLLVAAGGEPVRFSDIFEAAGVSRGSAYRIYIGMDDLLQDLAAEWVYNLTAFLEQERPGTVFTTWMELSDDIVERASRYWNVTAETHKVLPRIGTTSDPNYRHAVNELGASIAAEFDRALQMPRIPAWRQKLSLYTQILDVAFSDAVRATGRVDDSRVAEAQALCRTQLSFYLPADTRPAGISD